MCLGRTRVKSRRSVVTRLRNPILSVKAITEASTKPRKGYFEAAIVTPCASELPFYRAFRYTR